MKALDLFKIIPALAAVFLCEANLVLSQEPDKSPDAVLKSLRIRLERAMADLSPNARIEITDSHGGGSLIMRYQTRNYMIYPRTKSGRLGTELVESEGPGDEGILLRIHVQPKGEANQAAVPQTVRNVYWMTFLNVYPLEDSEKQIYIALSYRGHTDKALIQMIKEIAGGGAGQPAAGVAPEPAGDDAENHQ